MNVIRFARKLWKGLPYLGKELRAGVSKHTPWFVARPRMVHVWRRAPCNGRCIMCDMGFSPPKRIAELSKDRLTDAMIPGLLRQIAELGGRGTMVSYMGGEPLLNPAVLDWVEEAGRLRLDFRFTTNGYNVDAEMARRLVQAGLFNLGVSIESIDPAINEFMRPYPKATEKTLGAIDLLIAEKQRQRAPLSLNLKCTLTDVNLESILGLVERYGRVQGVLVTPQMFEAFAEMPPATREKLWIKDVKRIDAVVRELKGLKARGYQVNADEDALDDFARLYRLDPDHRSTLHERKTLNPNQPDCFIGNEQLFITSGSVHLCPFFPAIGDLIDDSTTLKQLWHSPAAHQMREQVRRCRTVCTLSCTRRTSLLHKIRTFVKM